MTPSATQKPFTGKRMAAIMVAGFGIVAAVNFLMASFAVSGFGGVIVENSYVASQRFNGWLEEAERVKALGWDVKASRDAQGFVEVQTGKVPAGAVITADLRRPLGEKEFASLAFTSLGDGLYRSTTPISAGRWTMRLKIAADDAVWTEERPL